MNEDRIFQIVAQAGGLLEGASFESVNQAMIAMDGQVIQVLTKDEYRQIRYRAMETNQCKNNKIVK